MADDTSSSLDPNLDYLAVIDIGAEVIRKAAIHDDIVKKYALRTRLGSEEYDSDYNKYTLNVNLAPETMAELGSKLQAIADKLESLEFYIKSIAER